VAKKEDLLAGFEKAYESARKKEAEELHNAIAGIIGEHKASIQNCLFVLELIKFELLRAKYEELMGTVKLTDKPPLPVVGKKPEK